MSAVPTTSAQRIAPPVSFSRTARRLPGDVAAEVVGNDVGRPLSFQPVCDEVPRGAAYCQAVDVEWDDREPGTLVTVYPFEFALPFACNGPVEGAIEKELLEEQRDTLERATDYALARELWTGAIRAGQAVDATPLSLVEYGVEVVAPAQSTMSAAFSLLLEARYGTTAAANGPTTGGVWHVAPQLIPAALAENQIAQVADRYVGPMGFDVVTDLGYAAVADVGPTGGDAGRMWLWLSGPVRYATSDIYFDPDDPAMRRANLRTNRYHVWAKRRGYVDVDPCTIVAYGFETVPQVVIS